LGHDFNPEGAMASWVGPTIAIALAIIAACYLGLAIVMIGAIREARQKSDSMARELADLRGDLGPALHAVNRFGESGSEIVALLRDEVGEVVAASQTLRRQVQRGVHQAQHRLADLDALLEVATEEADAALLDAANALDSVRTSAGLLAQVGRFLAPNDEEEDDEEYEDVDEELGDDETELEEEDA
jgi:hypothetical protein